MNKLACVLFGIGTCLAGAGTLAHAATPFLVSPSAIQSNAKNPSTATSGSSASTLAPGVARPATATIAADRIYSNIKSEIDLVALLRNQNKQLKALVKDLSQRLEQVKQEKPFCSDVATSANNAGMSRGCLAYICDPVQGACLQRAASTMDCAPGYLWDGGSKCITPPPPAGDPCPHWYSCL